MKPFNPFTRSLTHELNDTALKAFVEHWDGLEALVVRVFRAQRAEASDEAEWRALQAWLSDDYPRWREQLEPHWRASSAAGALASEDPFALLLAPPRAADFVANRRAMQFLPAAREALNRMLLSRA